MTFESCLTLGITQTSLALPSLNRHLERRNFTGDMVIYSFNGKLRSVPSLGVQNSHYPQKCTAKCTRNARKNVRKNAHRNAQTIVQTTHQPIYQTICEPKRKHIAFFARDFARISSQSAPKEFTLYKQ